MKINPIGSVRLIYDENSARFRGQPMVGLERFNDDRHTRKWIRRIGERLEEKRCCNSDISTEAPTPISATPGELSLLANRYLGTDSLSCFDNSNEMLMYRLYCKFLKIESYQEKSIRIAVALAEHQKKFLLSDFEYSSKEILTYDAIAKLFPWSESTTRRCIKTLRITWEKKTFEASDLMCTTDLGQLCAKVDDIRNRHPKAGAPRIKQILAETGYFVSQRQVGKAIYYLDRPSLSKLDACEDMVSSM